jgi:O-6-methylguanine DNA methyltransferase
MRSSVRGIEPLCTIGSRLPNVEILPVFLKATLPTPLGPMLAVTSEQGLCGLEFDRPERATRLWKRLARWRPGSDVREGDDAACSGVQGWLDAYFAGRWAECERLPVPLALLGTDFERAVWDDLMRIAPGHTRTYGAVARALGRRDASRAVGAAVGANPISLIVPCHRVVGSTGSLTGYGGGLERKEWLLRHEGALLL